MYNSEVILDASNTVVGRAFRYEGLYIWSRPPAGYPPPPHGMVQVGV